MKISFGVPWKPDHSDILLKCSLSNDTEEVVSDRILLLQSTLSEIYTKHDLRRSKKKWTTPDIHPRKVVFELLIMKHWNKNKFVKDLLSFSIDCIELLH